jgi:hypothetical protein
LHIGLAKSGTTYLQHILQANRVLLEENGLLFPGPKMSEHFKAALDLSGAAIGGEQPAGTEGAWTRTVDAANRYPAATLISHEMFAPIVGRTIGRAVRSFDTDDVRVVITARDIGRQVPGVWQERVKNGNQERYRDFLDSMFHSDMGRQRKGAFWRMQYLIDISSRWAEVVGADRLTIVTVPVTGADPDELWRRFGAAVGLPDLDYSLDVGGQNKSLGVVESELLRRLNGHLPELGWPQYVKRVKRRFAEGTLATASTSERLVMPGAYQEEISLIADETIGHVKKLGCHVIGDLEELRPRFSTSDPPTPDDVAESAVLELALAQLGHFVGRPPAPKPAAEPEVPPRTLLGALKAGLQRS